jgi:ribosomal protein S18 acetylase RimI-like enzyme
MLVEAKLDDLSVLTEMNIQLRSDEKIDNVMSANEVKSRMQSFIQSNEYKLYLLKDDDINYGYALINIVKKPNYLRQLYIIKEFRNKGLGTKLVNELMKILNINEIDVEVMVWNERAIKFYENFGFKRRFLGLRYKK